MKRIVSILMALIVAVQPVMTSGEPQEPAETDGISETVEVQGQVIADAGNRGSKIAIEFGKETTISEEYQGYCIEIGKKYHICPELLMAMIEQESSGRAEVINSAGDTGLLQVNPKWHKERMERLGVSDLTDPYSNILVAADYLAELFQESEGDIYLVLMKYNMRHDTAEDMFYTGKFSEYSVLVEHRAWELQQLHDEKGGKS